MALAAGCLDTSTFDGEPFTVFTQRAHQLDDDGIRLDLVIAWPRLKRELWIEVKTGAPLSGATQLDRYGRAQASMSARDGVVRGPLVLLSENDLRFAGTGASAGSARVPGPAHLAWQDVIEAVGQTPAPDTLWLELGLFLKEKGMTQETTFPISAREATSLSDAHRLFQKTVKLVTKVNELATGRFGVKWWTTGIPVFVQKQFRDKGRYTLGLWNGSKIGLLFGLETGRADEATFTVWLETDPKYIDLRPAVHSRAIAGDLEAAGWELQFAGWKLIQARAHTVNYATLDKAADWFIKRFEDLERVGLFQLLVEHKSASPVPATTEEDPNFVA